MVANRFDFSGAWYLGVNGYFTKPDFTIHPNLRKHAGGTDFDMLAVRFAYSEKLGKLAVP